VDGATELLNAISGDTGASVDGKALLIFSVMVAVNVEWKF
jgi:hypothetical protein